MKGKFSNKKLLLYNSILISSFFLLLLLSSLFLYYQSQFIINKIYADNNSFNFNDNPEDSVINCSPLLECNGTNNRDIIIGTSASDLIFGEDGNDLIQGGLLTDEIHGGKGDDTIQGGEGSDVIFGEEGNDFLFADSPNSAISLLVNQQNLNLEDSIGKEFHLQDPVIQTIDAEKLVDIIINELVSEVPLGIINSTVTESLLDIINELVSEVPLGIINSTVTESLLDKKQINNKNIQLSGGSGDDHIFGGSGDDILEGGSGKDFFDCNEGIDTVLDFNSKEDTIITNCEKI